MVNKRVIGAIVIFLSIVFFALGVYFPLLSTKQKILGIVLDYEEVNLFDSIAMFFNSQEFILAAIILLFTFIFPVCKYIELIIRIIRNNANKSFQHLDKWNMLDVFLVALLILNFKMNSNIIVMELKIGTTFIALAVVLRIAAISLLTRSMNENKAEYLFN